MCLIMLCPHADQHILKIANADTITETTPWNTTTFASSVPSSCYGSALLRRVVGAYVEVEGVAPDMVRTGTMVGAYLPYSAQSTGVVFDTLRDQPGSSTLAIRDSVSARVFYLPYDPSYFEFGDPDSTVKGGFPSLCIAVSGATNGTTGQSLRISYRVIYEIVPHPSKTDLLVTTRGPVGSFDANLRAVAQLLSRLGTVGSFIARGTRVAAKIYEFAHNPARALTNWVATSPGSADPGSGGTSNAHPGGDEL